MTRSIRVLSLYEGFFAGGARILHSDVVAGLARDGSQEHRVLSLTASARRDASLQLARDDTRYRRLREAGVEITAFDRIAGDRPIAPEDYTAAELDHAAALFSDADVVLSLKEQPLSLVVALDRAGLLPDVPVAACLHRSDPTHSGPALGWLTDAAASGAVTATISCALSTSDAYARAGVAAHEAWVIDNGIDTRRFRPAHAGGAPSHPLGPRHPGVGTRGAAGRSLRRDEGSGALPPRRRRARAPRAPPRTTSCAAPDDGRQPRVPRAARRERVGVEVALHALGLRETCPSCTASPTSWPSRAPSASVSALPVEGAASGRTRDDRRRRRRAHGGGFGLVTPRATSPPSPRRGTTPSPCVRPCAGPLSRPADDWTAAA